MAQWDQQHLGNSGLQVRSLAWHSGSRIWHCCSCGLGHDCGLDLIPSLGTLHGAAKKKKKNRIPFQNYFILVIENIMTISSVEGI